MKKKTGILTKRNKPEKAQYIFMVPNDEDGKKFLRLARRYIMKGYRMNSRGNHSDREGLYKTLGKVRTVMMEPPGAEAEMWRVYIQFKQRSSWINISKFLLEQLDRIRNVRLPDLMQEIAKEFKTRGPSESVAVKNLMERLLASFIAGMFKGKYKND